MKHNNQLRNIVTIHNIIFLPVPLKMHDTHI